MAETVATTKPEVSDDAQLILKLQEKLNKLKGQVHVWKARAKGMNLGKTRIKGYAYAPKFLVKLAFVSSNFYSRV